MIKEESVTQSPGFGQNVGITFGNVWLVHDVQIGELITTSGRLNTNTLDNTITQTIAGFQNRHADYVFSLNGVTVAILHPNDTSDIL